jgi:hypothetical protein
VTPADAWNAQLTARADEDLARGRAGAAGDGLMSRGQEITETKNGYVTRVSTPFPPVRVLQVLSTSKPGRQAAEAELEAQ